MTLPAGPTTFNGLNVLIIPDKFKGTLSATEAAKAIARGWRQVRSGDRLELLPMSDGGDGFGALMARILKASPRRAKVLDAAHRSCEARWWYRPVRQTALIDSARVVGLAMLPPGRFHPFQLDTFGLGLLLRAACRGGARQCLVGIGGSATNDGGFGMARALGWTFFDAGGRPIEKWTELKSLTRIGAPRETRPFKEITVAVDVDNPLLGPGGATRVYGPQKGLRGIDFKHSEACLARLARVVGKELGQDLRAEPGAGAAGGLGFGFAAFLGARLASGFDLFSAQAGVEARLKTADLAITGEGALDKSTLMGKGVGRIAERCRQLGIRCIGLAGTVGGEVGTGNAFSSVRALCDLTSVSKAKAQPAFWLERLAAEAAKAGLDHRSHS